MLLINNAILFSIFFRVSGGTTNRPFFLLLPPSLVLLHLQLTRFLQAGLIEETSIFGFSTGWL